MTQINAIRKIIPDCAITTDIIVGFPTESEEDFEDTVKLVKTVGFDGAFTFVYSKREGTKAAVMDGQVDADVQKNRIMRLIDIQNELNRKESETYIGKIVEILVEDFDEKKNTYMGRDERGKMAYFPYDENIIGRFVEVKICSAGGMSLIGEVNKVL